MNQSRMFFIQASTILSSMHQKLGTWKSAYKLTNSRPNVAASQRISRVTCLSIHLAYDM